MKLREYIEHIEHLLPLSWAEPWDAPGLCVGDPSRELSRAAISLDATAASVEAAAEIGAQLLFTHHPLLFHGVKKLVAPDPTALAIETAMRRGAAVYSAHTNWDSAPGGVNATLAELLDLRDTVPLVPSSSGAWGMGAVGSLPVEMSAAQLAKEARRAWGLSYAVVHDSGRIVSRAALCGGAGGDLVSDAAAAGADAFITSDIRHHEAVEALAAGISVIATDHGETESASLPALAALLRRAVPSVEVVLLPRSSAAPFAV